jgi:hypothetical protein
MNGSQTLGVVHDSHIMKRAMCYISPFSAVAQLRWPFGKVSVRRRALLVEALMSNKSAKAGTSSIRAARLVGPKVIKTRPSKSPQIARGRPWDYGLACFMHAHVLTS